MKKEKFSCGPYHSLRSFQGDRKSGRHQCVGIKECHSERSVAKSKNLGLISFFIFVLLLAGCSVYDNYDVDLMQDGFAAVSSSSDSLEKDLSSNNEPVASSSSDKKAKSSSSASAKNHSSNSENDLVSSSSESSSGVKSSASSVSSALSSGSSASAEPLSSSAESVTSSSSEGTFASSSSSVMSQSSSSDELAQSSSSDGPAVSSSSSAISSSSNKSRSSSSLSDWVCGVSTIKSRDYEYKTVQVGNTCWLKENVHYVPSRGKTTCYEGKTSNCDKYGPLYNYAAASMACPVGWKLPSKTEVDELLDAAGDDKPGLHLKSMDDWENGVGDDLLGMSILPAGCGLDADAGDLLYMFQGESALFWSSEVPENGTENAHEIIFLVGSDNSVAMEAQDDNVFYVSVRCVKE